MPNVARMRLVALVSVVPLALLITAQARGQEPNLEVFYNKLEPKEQFKYKIKGKEATASAGVFHWEVPKSEFSTGGFDRNFTGYCSEVQVPITAGKSYSFKMGSLYAPDNYSVSASPAPEKAAQKRATLIKELFGRYYRDAIMRNGVNADEAVGFQLALWELIEESEPAEGEAKFDLFGGDFQANYPKDQAPASALKAQEYLNSLTGDDSVYYSNPDTRGRELIRLKGIPNSEGVTAQSQFALRYAGGGGVGGTQPNRVLTNTGGAVAPLGGGGGGYGAGGGAGGLITTPNNGSGTVFPPTTTNPPPTPPIETPPINTPPETPPETPHDPTPVPAPAGLLLGAIALGTFGSWRLGTKLLGSK